jgi:hypothetical protein
MNNTGRCRGVEVEFGKVANRAAAVGKPEPEIGTREKVGAPTLTRSNP